MNHQSTLTEHATKTMYGTAQQDLTTLISGSKRSPSEHLEITMRNAKAMHYAQLN